MKHPLESLITVARILLLASLSCPLLPTPSLGLALAQKPTAIFHLMDLSQSYILLFRLQFLLLGVIGYSVLRFIWLRWFSLADQARESPSAVNAFGYDFLCDKLPVAGRIYGREYA